MDKIYDFIDKNHIMSICGSLNNIPYCANCFYAYDKNNNILLFASNEDTTHMKIFEKNPIVSGTIFLDTKNVSKIEGIQFQGKFIKNCNKDIYFKKFPFSKIMNPKIFGIKIYFIKYTNNSLGFGKKKIIGKTFFEK